MTAKKLTGQALADAYAQLKGVELGGKLWATHNGKRIEVRGEGLPFHPQHPWKSQRGWSLLDRQTVAHCREYLANRGCMGQWVAYEVGRA